MDDEVSALIAADRADRHALIAALKAALPHLAHQVECMDGCRCVIAQVNTALNGR